MSDIPEPSPAVRISACALSDMELAYLAELLKIVDPHLLPTGWSAAMAGNIENSILHAAELRGIKNGVRVVTQTVDLRS